MKNETTYKSLIEDIQTDLADYQNENGIGAMDDKQWQQVFVDRVIATITTFETRSQPIGTEIEKARQTLRDAGYLVETLWHTQDIEHQAQDMGVELSEEQVREVAEMIARNFDASQGINWDVIKCHIENIKN